MHPGSSSVFSTKVPASCQKRAAFAGSNEMVPETMSIDGAYPRRPTSSSE